MSDNLRIGVGITTTSNRPGHLALCTRQIAKHTANYTLHIATDVPTIARAKNECLYALKDCDYIFLFDDDCFPIKDGWVDFFINSGREHLMYLSERHGRYAVDNEIGLYSDCGGCFLYLTKEAFKKVGYFNAAYRQYGYEHAGFSSRINKNFVSLTDTDKYLYSLDYQGEGNWGVKHRPSITDYKAQTESIEYNRKVFTEEITSNKIYYEYEP